MYSYRYRDYAALNTRTINQSFLPCHFSCCEKLRIRQSAQHIVTYNYWIIHRFLEIPVKSVPHRRQRARARFNSANSLLKAARTYIGIYGNAKCNKSGERAASAMLA